MGANLQAWHNVVAMVADVHLRNQRDRFVWGLHQNGLFSVSFMYRALLGAQALPFNTLIWKLKLPLKIKVFMWYLYKGVILIKDNLARRQWQGDKKCCLCSLNESIQHLLFDCHFAKFMWRIVHASFNLIPPSSVQNLFTSWLEGINRKMKSQILVGANAICWVIWLTWNDIMFDKALAPSYLHVIFKGTYWTRYWSLIQKEEDCHLLMMGCRTVEIATMEVFARHDWRFANRLAF